ncbi:MAG: ParA family protein [Lentimicrobium sp.]|nr:ParA family protein [Lentimicrobium sp.]
MFVISVFSIKGGVGKTSAAINLATLASFAGEKTLLIDLDPQASSTFYLKVKPKIKTTVKRLLKGKSDIEEHIKSTEFVHLDILPATLAYREMETVLGEVKKAGSRIKDMILPLKDKYSWIFIDCPPGLTLLSKAIFNASNLVLIPVVPTTLSVRTYYDFIKFADDKPLVKGCTYKGFFSMVDRRKGLQKHILEEWDFRGMNFFLSSIPYLSDIEKMGIYLKPVVSSKPSSDAAKAFDALWSEIKKDHRSG